MRTTIWKANKSYAFLYLRYSFKPKSFYHIILYNTIICMVINNHKNIYICKGERYN